MNNPHKPGRADETERIVGAGGWITEEKELYLGRLHRMDLSDPEVCDKARQVTWVTIHRVCGEISVSRSIGTLLISSCAFDIYSSCVFFYDRFPVGAIDACAVFLTSAPPVCGFVSITNFVTHL
jgi:hypothetical protein